MSDIHHEEESRHKNVRYSCPTFATFASYTALVVMVIAIILPLDMQYGWTAWIRRLELNTMNLDDPDSVRWIDYLLYKSGLSDRETLSTSSSVSNTLKERIFTKTELSKYSQSSDVLYLALLGKVYDVSKGRQHYGKDGGYSFFSGIDGSRAFVTGEFNKEGLVDDVSDLSPSDYLGLQGWIDMYETDYIYVGKLVGFFYDENGNEREGKRMFDKKLEEARIWKAGQEEEKKLYPECNSRWTKDTGTVFWCSNRR